MSKRLFASAFTVMTLIMSSCGGGSGSSTPTASRAPMTYGEITSAVEDAGITLCGGLTETGSSMHIFGFGNDGSCSSLATAHQGLLHVYVEATPDKARSTLQTVDSISGMQWISENIAIFTDLSPSDGYGVELKQALDGKATRVK